MSKRMMTPLAAAVVLGLAVGPAHGEGDGHNSSNLRSELQGASELPVVVTGATGSFRATISEDDTSFTYELDYADLEGSVTQAHIHLAQPFANGGIAVWLCKTGLVTVPATVPADTPVCGAPGGADAEAAGTISAEDVLGPTGQGVPVASFADVLWAIRTGNAYVNVHSTIAPGGEIRGQLAPGGHSHHEQ